MLVDHDAAVLGFQARVVRERDVRPHACGADDEVGLDGLTAVRVTPVSPTAATVFEPRKRTPLRDSSFATRSPTSSPNRRCSGTGSAATMVVVDAEFGETGGGLATDQAAADDDGRIGVAGRHLEDDGVGEASAGSMRIRRQGRSSGTAHAPQASTRCQYP